MPQTKRPTIRIDDDLYNDIMHMADNKKSFNHIIEEALKFYRDYMYMKDKATIINREVIKITEAQMNRLEHKINNRTNQVLSETAIQLCVLNLVIAHNLEVDQTILDSYRKNAVDFLKANQRVLKLNEVI